MGKQKFSRTLVTAALPYANGGVHIGHLAGVYVPADIYVRYLRLKGEEVLFIGGSDEHGVPITIRARREGVSPQAIVDRYHTMIKRSFEEFGISFDIYSRTTSETHHRFAAQFFRTLYDNGKLTERTTEQYYDEEARQFLADRYIVGECPHCHNPQAYGDQCEKCGSDLDPTELIRPHSTISGSKPVMRKTTNWYLPLGDYQAWLKSWILEEHKEWRPNVYGQCRSWLDLDLLPRAMTRDLDWGIPVPVEGAEGKVLYVWFDAPIGYISNTIELLPDSWEKWWKDPSTRLVHFIGKDNIVFHCIVFPVMLKAHGGFILPDNVPANEFLNLENDKISTSRNWAVWLDEYLTDFPGKQDVLRYVLTANAPETKDNNFTWKDFQDRNNNELVAVYGNFVNRALQLTMKYFGGTVPAAGELTAADNEALGAIRAVKGDIDECMDSFKFRDAQRCAMGLAREGNRYITECEPWKIWKSDRARVATVLNISLQIVANLAIAFEPFLPFSSARLHAMIGTADNTAWSELGRTDLLPAGHALGTPSLLFEKISDEAIGRQLAKLEETKKSNAAGKQEQETPSLRGACTSPGGSGLDAGGGAAAAKGVAAAVQPVIPFGDFEKVDIRVGRVTACERVPSSDKLLKLTVDDGTPTPRTIVSGIAKATSPEELTGRDILFVANIAPRKLMGIESQGMILCAEGSDGKLTVASTMKDARAGSRVR